MDVLLKILKKGDVARLQPRPHISQIPELLFILSEKKQF